MDKNSEEKSRGGEAPGGVAKKINVSFDQEETEFNKPKRRLEDIVDEELEDEQFDEGVEEFADNSEESSREVYDPVEEYDNERPSSDAYNPAEDEEGLIGEPEEVIESPEEEIEEEREKMEPVSSESPIRAGKKKSGNGVITFLVVVIILLVGGFVAYYLLATQTIKNDFFADSEKECVTAKDSPKEEETPVAIREDEGVIGIVEKIREGIENSHGQTTKLINTYNQTFPLHKINEDGTLFALNKSYGLYYDSEGDEWMELSPQLNSDVMTVLKGLGFTEYAEGGFGAKYYSDGNGVICGPMYSDAGSFWNFACASESWISEENEKLVKELAEAYKAKTGKAIGVLYVEADKISESGKNKDYEAVMGQGDGAAQIFYRKKNGEWKYGFGAQAVPSCSVFDDEMREALSGWTGASSINKPLTCYNDETGVEEEV